MILLNLTEENFTYKIHKWPFFICAFFFSIQNENLLAAKYKTQTF